MHFTAIGCWSDRLKGSLRQRSPGAWEITLSLGLLVIGPIVGLQHDSTLGSSIIVAGVIVVAINYWWHTRGKHER